MADNNVNTMPPQEVEASELPEAIAPSTQEYDNLLAELSAPVSSNIENLIEAANAKSAQSERLEAAFSRLTISRVLGIETTQAIAAAILMLIKRFRDYNDQLGKDLTVEQVIEGFMTFAFKREKRLIVGIIARVFEVSEEQAGLVPLSCIHQCIFKDEVVQGFLSQRVNAAMTGQSSISMTAGFPLPPTPITLTPDGKKTLTGSNSKAKK